jgi:hypothetical protein
VERAEISSCGLATLGGRRRGSASYCTVSKVSTTGRGTSTLSTYLCIALYLCPFPPCTYNYISFHVSNRFPFSRYCTFKKVVKKAILNPVRVCPSQLLLVYFKFYFNPLKSKSRKIYFTIVLCTYIISVRKIFYRENNLLQP